MNLLPHRRVSGHDGGNKGVEGGFNFVLVARVVGPQCQIGDNQLCLRLSGGDQFDQLVQTIGRAGGIILLSVVIGADEQEDDVRAGNRVDRA